MGQGTNAEREIANWFDSAGYAVMRAGGSGSGTTRDQPDTFAGKKGERIAAEAKYSSGSMKYLDREEILRLIRFAHKFGAVPVIILRWKGQRTFWVYRIEDLHETRGESLRADKDDRENSLRSEAWPWPLSDGGRGVTTSAFLHGRQSNTFADLLGTEDEPFSPDDPTRDTPVEVAARVWDLPADPLSREWTELITDG